MYGMLKNSRKIMQGRNKPREWNKELDTVDGERFVEAFMVIRERALLKLFLSDLFTEKELAQFVKRFEGVYWLSLGMPYTRIQETTGLSPKIIARLSKGFINKRGGFWRVMMEIQPRTWNAYEAREWADREPPRTGAR